MSGVRTNTVTSRCPVCLKVRYHTVQEVHDPQKELSPRQLCCCIEHQLMQSMTIAALAAYEKVWIQQHYPGLLVIAPWEAQGHFWTEHGGIDAVDKSAYKGW